MASNSSFARRALANQNKLGDFVEFILNGAVMLREAKHLWPISVGRSIRFKQRFFSRDCGIRMTFMRRLVVNIERVVLS
jgi:hypothetical protein